MKDRIKTDGTKMQHSPTEEKLVASITNPLQGSLFWYFRDVLLGYKHINTLKPLHKPISSPDNAGKGNLFNFKLC
jgi:hypothetical protein